MQTARIKWLYSKVRKQQARLFGCLSFGGIDYAVGDTAIAILWFGEEKPNMLYADVYLGQTWGKRKKKYGCEYRKKCNKSSTTRTFRKHINLVSYYLSLSEATIRSYFYSSMDKAYVGAIVIAVILYRTRTSRSSSRRQRTSMNISNNKKWSSVVVVCENSSIRVL